MITENANIVQNPFWDMMNEFEMPLIINLRQIFCIEKTKTFWKKFAILGSSSFITSMPTILFTLGFVSHSKKLSSSLIFYALISSFGKDLFKRRRPSTYEKVQVPTSSSVHSFPSRHTMGMTILACFTPYKYQLVCFMVLDRILMGKHFLTDCIAGYFFGELCVFLGTFIQNMNFLLIVLSVDMMIWNGAVRVMAETIPILMAPDYKQSSMPLAYTIIALKFVIVYTIKKSYPKSEKAKKLIADFFASSLIIFIVLQFNTFIQSPIGNGDVQNIPIYNSTKLKIVKKIEEATNAIKEEYTSNFAEMTSFSSL